jgi:NAD(P)H-dependent FMN reductase
VVIVSISLALVIGTTRPGRFADKPALWVTSRLAATHPEIPVDVVDLRDHPLPPFAGISPARTGRDYPSAEVEAFGSRIDRADGYVVLTGEYNHGYPGVLKNAMDHTFVEWRRKPISFVGWGNVGGARAIEQLRGVAVEYEMAPLRHAVHILPERMIAAMQAPEPFDIEIFDSLNERLDLLITDLQWWAEVLAQRRAER